MKEFILRAQGKVEGDCIRGELITGMLFLFTGRWAYKQGWEGYKKGAYNRDFTVCD